MKYEGQTRPRHRAWVNLSSLTETALSRVANSLSTIAVDKFVENPCEGSISGLPARTFAWTAAFAGSTGLALDPALRRRFHWAVLAR
jgi:hypothetical protein